MVLPPLAIGTKDSSGRFINLIDNAIVDSIIFIDTTGGRSYIQHVAKEQTLYGTAFRVFLYDNRLGWDALPDTFVVEYPVYVLYVPALYSPDTLILSVTKMCCVPLDYRCYKQAVTLRYDLYHYRGDSLVLLSRYGENAVVQIVK